MADWHFTMNGEQVGSTVNDAQLRQLAVTGKLKQKDMVWTEGMPGWAEASTIPGLFPAAASPARAATPKAAAPKAARAPSVAEVEPVNEPAAAGGSSLIDPITDLRRAYSYNLYESPVTGAEQSTLAQVGVTGELGQKFLVWRRSMLWLTLFVTLVTALVGLISSIMAGFVLPILSQLLTLCLPVAATMMAVLFWSKYKVSRAIMLAGWAAPIAVSFLFSLIGLLMALADKGDGSNRLAFMMLAPLRFAAILALGGGLFRACVRVKTLVPESVLPGYVLVCAAALYVFTMVQLVFVSFAMGRVSLGGFGELLFVCAPLSYLALAPVFLRSSTKPADRTWMMILQLVYLGVAALGTLLFMIPSLMEKNPMAASPILTNLEAWLTYISTSLLTTIVAADLLIGGVYAQVQEGKRATERLAGLGELFPK